MKRKTLLSAGRPATAAPVVNGRMSAGESVKFAPGARATGWCADPVRYMPGPIRAFDLKGLA